MRTTVARDEDIVAALHAVMRERGAAHTYPSGAATGQHPRTAAPASQPYRQDTYHAKVQPGVSVRKALQLAGIIEDEYLLYMIEPDE